MNTNLGIMKYANRMHLLFCNVEINNYDRDVSELGGLPKEVLNQWIH